MASDMYFLVLELDHQGVPVPKFSDRGALLPETCLVLASFARKQLVQFPYLGVQAAPLGIPAALIRGPPRSLALPIIEE